MKSIIDNCKNEIIIKNSKFITLLFKLNNEKDVNTHLKNIKNEYKKADHYCYAYILNNIKKYSDDKEPNKTAGLPILNTLELNNYNLILCVVVRYFGGIKLGSNGLIRAYRKSVAECLKKAKTCNLKKGFLIQITFDFEIHDTIMKIIEKENIINKNYIDIIKYSIITDKKIINQLKSLCEVKIIKEAFIIK